MSGGLRRGAGARLAHVQLAYTSVLVAVCVLIAAFAAFVVYRLYHG